MLIFWLHHLKPVSTQGHRCQKSQSYWPIIWILKIILRVMSKAFLPMYKLCNPCTYISIRSQLECCSVIWNPNELKKFIKHLCYKSKIQYSTDNYPALCHHFRLMSHQHRRQVADLISLHKCVHSHLDSSYLLGNIQYHCPSRSLRNFTPFRISNSRINIRKCSVLNIWLLSTHCILLC